MSGTRPRTEKRRIWEAAYREKRRHLEAGRMREYRARDPERTKLRSRINCLKGRYGITPDCYDAMLKKQGGKCAICREKERASSKSRFHVDHCHVTNVVRGLLCGKCNVALGLFQDNPVLLKQAAVYLLDAGSGV